MTTTETTTPTLTPTLRKLRTWGTRDGGGYQFELLLDGVHVATVTEHGMGGPLDWHTRDADRLRAWAGKHGVAIDERGLPPCDSALDRIAATLVDDVENAKRMRRLCAKSLCYRLPTDEPGVFYKCKGADSPALRAAILAKHPAAVFLNDTAGKA